MVCFLIFGKKVCMTFGFFMSLLLLLLLFPDEKSVLLGLFICLLHECGHLAVCVRKHLPIRELRFAAGGLTLSLQQNEQLLPFSTELLLQSGGIICTLLFAGIFALCGLKSECYTALLFSVYHLIPAKNLDGGRIFCLLAQKLDKSARGFDWQIIGSIIAFLIYLTLALLGVRYGQMRFALMMGLSALLWICF